MANDARRIAPAREEDIAAVETAVGRTLPPRLRERLLVANGFLLDDGNGVTGRVWTMLPVLDRSSPRSMARTADDIARATALARRIDRVSSPGFGQPQPGRPFPEDGVVIGHGTWQEERLVLLPATPDGTVLGTALYRQMQFSPLQPLGVDLADFAPSASEIDAIEPLPTFRYHPDPVATGAIRLSPNVCSVCSRQRGSQYTAARDVVCPWCIADGSAAREGWCFVDAADLDVSPDVAAELELRTPGFATFQELRWPTCCGDACAFVGTLDGTGVASLDTSARADAGIDDELFAELVAIDEPADDPAVFGFRCLHCGRLQAVLDFS